MEADVYVWRYAILVVHARKEEEMGQEYEALVYLLQIWPLCLLFTTCDAYLTW